ncbi:MAG: alpha/beta fold hydrolase [Dehalococcoidia bacterium]
MARELRTKPAWLGEIFPFEQKAVEVNGRTMAYVEAGPADGRPVLLLSGNPTWGFLYREFFGPLATAGYRAIAPDWVGAGYSDHPRLDSALTFAHHIADLVSFIDQLGLNGFVVVGQDWGGPQGLGAAAERAGRLGGLVLMSTWAFTGGVGRFHSSPRPWTTWHAPLIGQFFMKRLKVLSQQGPSAISRRGMSDAEGRAYHHVYDEPESDSVVLTWPRTIPMTEGDRGWEDMTRLEARLGEVAHAPALLLWGTEDSVFGKSYADRLKERLPEAEGPFPIENADHFMQDDQGPAIAARIVEFLDRRLGPAGPPPVPEPEARSAEVTRGWSFALSDQFDGDLADVRADPLLSEQELDVRPEVARAIGAAFGANAGRRYWRSAHGHQYALELGDLGRGLPSTATVFGLWPRWEPRPPEREIDLDLLDFSTWLAEVSPGIDPEDVRRVAARAGVGRE